MELLEKNMKKIFVTLGSVKILLEQQQKPTNHKRKKPDIIKIKMFRFSKDIIKEGIEKIQMRKFTMQSDNDLYPKYMKKLYKLNNIRRNNPIFF